MRSTIEWGAAALAGAAMLAAVTPSLAAPPSPVAPVAEGGAQPVQPAPLDPELLAPLTPLDQFTVQAAAPKGEAPARSTTITYAVTVEGLAKVGLQGRFRALSSLYAAKGRADTTAQIAARAGEDVKLAERLLRSQGYYDGRADVATTPAADGQGRITVAITATPGSRYTFGEVAVTGSVTRPPGIARKALPLQPGQPIVAPAVEAAEANVSLRLPEQGYPFVKLGARDIALDGADHTGDYALPVTAGPRSSFAGFRLAGDPVFTPQHVGVISRFKPGELYDSRKVDDLRRALVATTLFSSVGVQPVDTGHAGPDGTEAVDLLVTGKAAPTHTISGGLGYETGLGASAEAEWTLRNLFPPEGALTLQGLAGTEQSLIGATFRRSNAGQRDRSFQTLVQASNEDLDAYRANTIRVAASLSRDSTPIWQKRWTWSVGAEGSVSQETGYDLKLGESVRRTYEIGALPLQLGYDTSDSLLDPTRGFRLTLRPSPEISFGDGTQPYLKAILEGTAYQPFGQAFVLAGRLRFGGLFGADASDIAPSRRFFSGGGGSVRGYGYQEIGPRDPSNNPIGGSSLTEFSMEGRYRFGNFGLVGFLDGGQVYESSTPRFSDLQYGIGVGGRFYTNFGPLRLDVATPLNRQSGDSIIALYISIGQAF